MRFWQATRLQYLNGQIDLANQNVPHDEGGFGVSNNTITRHAASYTTNARFVAFLDTFARPAQQVWLSGNDLQDPSS
jgi:hypothetical protein